MPDILYLTNLAIRKLKTNNSILATNPRQSSFSIQAKLNLEKEKKVNERIEVIRKIYPMLTINYDFLKKTFRMISIFLKWFVLV